MDQWSDGPKPQCLRIGRVESFGKVSMSIFSPCIPLVAVINIVILHATYLTARWSTTLTRVGTSSIGRVVVIRLKMISLVATGNRVTFMVAATISGYECRR